MSPLVRLGLLGAYLLLLGGIVVQYRRGRITRRRLLVLLGLCFTWLSYSLVQLSRDGLVTSGTALNYALDGLSVAMLAAGLFLLYRWWRERDGGREHQTSSG